MGKKPTEEDVKNFIADLVNQVNDELYKEFLDLRDEMMVYEFRLLATFNKKQEKLYKDFCEARQRYYDLGKELYVRKGVDNK